MKQAQPRDEFVRKRIERQKKIRKRRLIIFFVFFVIIALCVCIALSLTVFFPIEAISISGSKVYTAEQIEKASGIKIGDNLFTVSHSEVEKELKSELPYIESIVFKRELPGTLKINVKDSSEYACYFINEKYYTVSKEGWVIKESDTPPQNIFVITGCKAECEVGSEIKYPDEETKTLALELVSALLAEEIEINGIDISNNIALEVKVEGRFTVNLGTSNNIEEKIKHLSGMIKNISEEKQGKINLSMWTTTNTKGTFIEENAE